MGNPSSVVMIHGNAPRLRAYEAQAQSSGIIRVTIPPFNEGWESLESSQ